MQKSPWVVLACLFLVIPFPNAFAHNDIDDVPIKIGQELVEWCKNEAEQRYLGQDKTPRNWRVSHLVKGNYLITRLTFNIEYADKHAECQIRKGAQRRYAVFQEKVD